MIATHCVQGVFLRQERDKGSVDGQSEAGSMLDDMSSGRGLVCAACGNPVTSHGARISVNGSFEHVFANPHGYVFEVHCYASAPGCAVAGEPTSEFSWFPGYWWSFALCARCSTHLGWRFGRGPGPDFFGLIPSRLVEARDDEAG